MTGTLINETNSDLFLPAVPTEVLLSSDMFIGVTDEETDTACGVLAAAAIGDHVLAIRFLWVADEYRGRGAGKELVLTLMEAAEDMNAASVVCVHSRGNVSDGVSETLTGCGFVKDDEQTVPIYAATLSEIRLAGDAGISSKTSGIKIRPLAAIDDVKWQVAGLNWKSADGPAAGLRALSLRRGVYDSELSFVALDKNEDICGMLLVERTGFGCEIKALSAMGKNVPITLYALIENALDNANKVLGEDGRIIISPVASHSMELFEQLTGGAYITVGETAVYTYDIQA